MKIAFGFALCVLSLCACAQKKKVFLPLWTFHQKNANIYGVSVGLFNLLDTVKNTTTNGLRLCLIGEGLAYAFIPHSPVPEDDTAFAEAQVGLPTEKINGISLSGTGMIGHYDVNGVSIGTLGVMHRRMNGISIGALNFADKHQGLQIGFGLTEAYRMRGFQIGFGKNKAYKARGFQIGLYNVSKDTRGLQIGLWNVNEKRKLPLINWNFSKKKS